MASISRAPVHFIAVRNAGFTENNVQYGGIYHPAHVNAGGIAVSSRFESNFMINHKGFIDAQGQQQVSDPDVIHLTAWSGKQSDGNGMAEKFARALSVGLEISVDANINTFESRQYDNGSLVCRADGTPITVRNKVGFVVVGGTLVIGVESDKHIQNEVMKYQASGGRAGRPQNWNNKAHPDFQIWRELNVRRNAEMYAVGSKTFGYSIVQLARGAQGAVYGNAPAGINAAMVAGAMNQILVDNFTLDQWKIAGATDEQMLASPKFAAFHPAIMLTRGTGPVVPGPVLPVGPDMSTIVTPAPDGMAALAHSAF